MKKLITILFILGSLVLQAQDVKIDSINIYVPGIPGKVKSLKKKEDIGKTLDSLSKIYRTDKFNAYKYLSNGDVYKCTWKKPETIKLQSI